ncbi:HNH endonuclease [Sphingomonas sp. Leaf23]|uniref:HNH endonuclease n=1 Tax=Sphingomonas sp. Leaf23 TaxID=1735689 RepID=UPI0012E1B4D9|nr:NUMOD4 motif-containing HNH endonuclease [Sphingomonas sp. Leaf23]
MQTDAEVAAKLDPNQRWIPGYEGYYAVCDQGLVYSFARTFTRTVRGRRQVVTVPARVMIQHLNRNGRPVVALNKDGKSVTRETHRLVCRAFHGEPDGELEASHVNGIRTDNRAENLAWKTRLANMRDKHIHGTHAVGSRANSSKLTETQARTICWRALNGESPTRVGREYGVGKDTVRMIRDGRRWGTFTQSIRVAQHLKQENAK